MSVAVEGCTVEPEREVLEWDASIASSYHRVLIPPDCAARAFACRARVEAQGKTVFDAAFAVQRSSAAALSGPCSPTAPSVSLQGSACSTSSSSSSSSSWSSDTSRALGSPPKTTQLLLFACSPHVSPLPQAGSEAVEVALATSWGELGDAVRISFGASAPTSLPCPRRACASTTPGPAPRSRPRVPTCAAWQAATRSGCARR